MDSGMTEGAEGGGCDLGSEVWNWDWTVVETRPRERKGVGGGRKEGDK